MKQVVNGKLYDTETAELIHTAHGTWAGQTYSLYRTDNGRFFIYFCAGDSWQIHVIGKRKEIWPKTEEEAMEWLEENAPVEVLLSRFPDKVEEA